MADFGLSEKSTALIHEILKKYPEVEQAIIYGSRAKGNYREGSDIDLTLKGERLTSSILSSIWLDLDESYSPYLFDLSIFCFVFKFLGHLARHSLEELHEVRRILKA